MTVFTSPSLHPSVLRVAVVISLILGCAISPAATLWSTEDSYLGTGYFFGPGAYTTPTPLFPAMIRNMGFTSDRDFVTPFWNNGAASPNVLAEQDFSPVDGKLSDGTKINENVDLGSFSLGGVNFLPAVAEGGEFSGQQVIVTMTDGNLVMVMDLVLDMGIGTNGIIRLPFYGTTGTIAIPQGIPSSKGQVALDRAGPLHAGATISGRIGDFNNDRFIDGTLVAAGVMPDSSPVYAGQPFVLTRNFETDVPIAGELSGSPIEVSRIYYKAY